jgi:starch synthase
MYVVMIAPECAPVAHAGGLGDVVFGLGRELEIRGHAVEITLPKYQCLRYDQIWGLTVDYHDLAVPWFNGAVHCSVWFGFVQGRKCFFIEPHSPDYFFARNDMYGFSDDALRFAFFSKAALEYMLKTDKRPDVIHCHEWHTGLVPVLLFEIYKFHGMPHQRVCYTIHNFRHQGLEGERALWATGLGRPDYYFHHDRLQDNFNGQAIKLREGGDRLFEFRDDGLTRTYLGGASHRAGIRVGSHPLRAPAQAGGRAERHRLRCLEPGNRPGRPASLRR